MQRYNPVDLGNGCLPHELMEHTLDGNYVLAEEAQAEIDALHAECDRLTALLGKPKVLEAHEVTESGFYLVRADNSNPWVPCVVSHFNARSDPLRMLLAGRSEALRVAGKFIGPLPVPEV